MRYGSYVALVAVLLLVCGGVLFASIGENFEPAGVVLSGSAGCAVSVADWSYYYDPNRTIFEAWASPSVGLLLARNLSISLTPWFRMAEVDGWSFVVGGSIGADFYIVPHPDRSAGTVAAFSAAVSAGYDFAGAASASLSPSFALYFFVTDRIAPSISLSGFGAGLERRYWSRRWQPQVWVDPRLTLGMSYWLPSSEMVLRKRK